MGKMKNLLIEEETSKGFLSDDDIEAMMEESHYWSLVDNVAQWMVDNKALTILDDIEKKYKQLWRLQ